MAEISTDILIIGGGAAGLMAAYGASSTLASEGCHRKVTVLEKMTRPGRKIMITGKGRCNFTNVKMWNEFCGHLHPKSNLLKPAFHNLTPVRLMEFMSMHGMETVVERGDRAFPASHMASDVVDTLTSAAEEAGAQIHCHKEVAAIHHDNEGRHVIRCTDGSSYLCNKLIICTGGLSYPKTGSTGDGYEWAEKMGHSIKRLFPSLTAIVPKGYKETEHSIETISKGHIHRNVPLSEQGRLLKGNQLKNIRLSIIIDGNEVQNEFGDLDFTDGGIEGPVGFKVSRRCVNAMINGSKVTAVIDLKPAVEEEELRVRIKRLWDEISKDRKDSKKPYKDRLRMVLNQVLPQSLIPAFIRLHPDFDHKSLPEALKNWKIDIAGYVGYERCVVTAGGISSDEMNMKTFESKICPGIYFAGEILDIDADTGGYNLHAAFATGYLAGISAAKSLIK